MDTKTEVSRTKLVESHSSNAGDATEAAAPDDNAPANKQRPITATATGRLSVDPMRPTDRYRLVQPGANGL